MVLGKERELRRSMGGHKEGAAEPKGCSWKHCLEEGKMLPLRPDKRHFLSTEAQEEMGGKPLTLNIFEGL